MTAELIMGTTARGLRRSSLGGGPPFSATSNAAPSLTCGLGGPVDQSILAKLLLIGRISRVVTVSLPTNANIRRADSGSITATLQRDGTCVVEIGLRPLIEAGGTVTLRSCSTARTQTT